MEKQGQGASPAAVGCVQAETERQDRREGKGGVTESGHYAQGGRLVLCPRPPRTPPASLPTAA